MKQRNIRIAAFLLALLLFITGIPMASSATETMPTIGNATNVVNRAKITAAGVDVTETYKKDGVIVFKNMTDGYVNNLIFGSSNSFTFSAKVKMSDASFALNNHGSVRLIIGTGKDSSGTRRNIELCIRPGLSGTGFFMRNGTDEKQVTAGTTLKGLKKQQEYTYTVVYENGKVTFWANDGEQSVKFYDRFDITGTLSDIELAPGFSVRSCNGAGDEDATVSNIQIWGSDLSVLAPPEITASDKDLIKEVSVTDVFTSKMYKLTDGKLISTANKTGRIDFNSVILNGDYCFYADASFKDNTNKLANGSEYNWERLIFRVATAEKDGKTQTIEVRVGSSTIYVYAYVEAGNEKLLQSISIPNAFDETKSYVLDYSKKGVFDFWQNGSRIFNQFDLSAAGFTNIKPALGLGAEVCSFSYSNMHLISPSATLAASVPQMPAGNGNYGDYMYVPSNSVVISEGNKVYSVTDTKNGSTEFDCLPFDADDTYVFGFDLMTEKADEDWKGARIIIGQDQEGNTLYLYTMKNDLMVMKKDKTGKDKKIYGMKFPRELGTTYRIDMLLEPENLSVWINDVLLIDKLVMPKREVARTGVLFEKALATMSNIDLYYTTPVKFVKPDIPEKPVLKTIGKNQFNAADWMKVTLNGSTYGYFGNRLAAPVTVGTTTTVSPRYLFENIPASDNMSYYYSATYRVDVRKETWQGPRFIVRHIDDTPVYVIVTVDTINVLAGAKSAGKGSFKTEIGKSYDIVIYSTPTRVSVWIDGTLIVENADLTPFFNGKTTTAKMGLLFENCTAEVTNLAIYGSQIKFNEEFIDPELYYSKEFNMAGIHAMPEGGLNLFSNITMKTDNKASLGAKFDKEENVLITQFNAGTEATEFKDAKGSSNLNGLKNKSGYVFSFSHKVDSWTAQDEKTGIESSGFWATVNLSKVPGGSTENSIKVGMDGEALKLVVLKTGKTLIDIKTPVERQNGKEYNIAIVHGKNWIKVYLNNELKIVATDLPTYNVAFNFKMMNIQGEFKNFKLYEFSDSGLTILPTVATAGAVNAGNTIINMENYDFVLSRYKWPIVLAVISGTAVVISGTILTVVLLNQSKRRKQKTQIGGETTCEKE